MPLGRFSAALGLGLALCLTSGAAQALPPASSVTTELVEAAGKEGAVNFYTSVDVEVAESVKKAFEAKYPAVRMSVERSGAQRLYQRLGQEYDSGIFNADVVNSADAAHFVVWQRNGWLAPYLPAGVSEHLAKQDYEPSGLFVTWKASLSVIGYNTKYVKPDQAPKGY